ncbi:MAG: HTTM domain-containing protein [Pirellulales bacterium]
MTSIISYIREATSRFGAGWNAFWFEPRDVATVALMRILSGVMALYFVASFSPDLMAWFGADGMLPVSLAERFQPDGAKLSYLTYLSSPTDLGIAHAASLIVVVLYTAGMFTRVTSVLATIAVLSYIHRAPVVTSQFEPVLAMTMVYLCIAPTGRRWSFDAWRAARKAEDEDRPLELKTTSVAANVATRLIQIHLCAVFVMMALAKISGEAWWSGIGVWWLIARPDSRLVDLTGLLAEHPYIINLWTHGIVLFEFAFPVLIWNRTARPMLIVLAALHWSMLALITSLVPFCVMMFIATLAFVEPPVVRGLMARLSHATTAPVPSD